MYDELDYYGMPLADIEARRALRYVRKTQKIDDWWRRQLRGREVDPMTKALTFVERMVFGMPAIG